MEHIDVAPSDFAALDGVDDWRWLLRSIRATFRFGSFPDGGAFVDAVARAAEAAGHHPDVSLRYPGVVVVTLTTHAVAGVTELDVDLARTISGLAADVGAVAEPLTAKNVEIAIDTMDPDAIRPFWAAVLGYEERDGSLHDPARSGPSIWFQQMIEPRTERNRFHIDIDVPHDLADDRVAAAIAAGGTLVTEEFARAWWVLADADGNEACICTWQDRAPS